MTRHDPDPEDLIEFESHSLVRPHEIGLVECCGCDRLVEEIICMKGYGPCCWFEDEEV